METRTVAVETGAGSAAAAAAIGTEGAENTGGLAVWDSDEVTAGSGFGLGLLGFSDGYTTGFLQYAFLSSGSPKIVRPPLTVDS